MPSRSGRAERAGTAEWGRASYTTADPVAGPPIDSAAAAGCYTGPAMITGAADRLRMAIARLTGDTLSSIITVADG